MHWQRTTCSSHNIVFAYGFSLLAAREVTFFARHNAARMYDVEHDESNEHEGGVEDILVGFMDRDTAVVASRIFDQAEDDTYL